MTRQNRIHRYVVAVEKEDKFRKRSDQSEGLYSLITNNRFKRLNRVPICGVNYGRAMYMDLPKWD